MRGAIFLLLVFICAQHAFSQSKINGTVKDDKGQPMPLATVKVFTQNRKQTYYAVTDDKGGFQVNVPDSVTATAIAASYLKQNSDTLKVTASPYELIISSAQQLSGITVSSQEPALTRQADRFVFVPGKAMAEGATSLDLLKMTPLIQYDARSEALSIINKEGTIVYINNRKSNMPKDMILSQLRSTPAENIKSIEIITNPGSEYAANTTGGIININLKRLMDEGWFGTLTVSTEQSVYNTAMLNGAISYRKNKVGLKLSPFINHSYNYYTAENTITKEDQYQQNIRSRFRRYDVYGGGIALDYDISKKDLLSINSFFSTVGGKSHLESETYYAATNDFNSSPVKGKDHYIYNFGNVYYKHEHFTLNIDYNHFYQKNTDIGSLDTSSYKNILPEKFFNLSAAIDYATQLSKHSKLNIGAQVSNTSMKNDLSYTNFNNEKNQYETDTALTRLYKYDEDYLALYISYGIAFSDKLNGSLGLRNEYTHYITSNETAGIKADTSYNRLFPNVSLAYQISKNSNLSFAASKKIKRANIELLFPGRTYYNADYYSENNPFLQPAIVNNAELLYALKNKYYFTGGYTQGKNQYAQFIIPDEDLLQKKTYLNYGDVSTMYCSFYTMQKFFKGFWESNISAAVNYNTYKAADVQLLIGVQKVSNTNFSASMNNTLYLSRKKKWLGFVNFKYISPVEYLSFKRENSLFNTDLGVRKTINNFSVNLYLSDIFNTSNITRQTYRPNAAYTYNRLVQNNYTRSVYLSIRYSLGNNKLNQIKNKKIANEDIKNRIN